MPVRSFWIPLFVCLAAGTAFPQCTSVALNNNGAFAAVGGGNGTFNATGTPSSCNKTVASNAEWISISFGGGTANPSTVGYNVQTNTSVQQRVGTISINGGLATFTVTQAGIICTNSLTPNNATVANSGGSGSIAMTTQNGCSWTAVSNESWIQVSPTAGQNSGMIGYSVLANPDSTSRTGTITIGSATFSITQAAACSFALSPTFASVRSAGDGGTITVTATNSACTRNATSDSSWLTISSGTSGTGNGTVGWTAAVNQTADRRTGNITVGNAVFSVIQEGGTCNYQISPTNTTVLSIGGSGTFNLVTNCAWQAVSTAEWLTMSSSASGTGNGSVSWVAAPNVLTQGRSASISIGNVAFTVQQAAVACSISLSISSYESAAGGGDSSVNVLAASGCTWQGSSNVPWITFTSAAAGSADGTISFRVAANTTPGSRQGTITIGNRLLVVTQVGANCELGISPTSVQVASNASSGSIAVTTTCLWTAISSTGWIGVVNGASGVGNGTVDFTVGANATAGTRTGTIKIGNLTFTVTQTGGTCTVTLAPTNLTLPAGTRTGRFTVNGTPGCSWEPTSAQPWLTVEAWSAVNGSGSVDFRALPNLTGSGRTGTLKVLDQTYTLTQAAERPTLAANGILNAASFRGGPIAAGEIITIYGNLLGPERLKTLELNATGNGITSSLAGTRVLINGTEAPLIYTSDRQLSAIVPYDVGTGEAKVRVEYQGQQSDEATIAVAPTAAAIFTQNASGSGPSAILNQNFELNTATTAAARGSILQIFLTGTGALTPAQPDGGLSPGAAPFPRTVVVPTVRIGTLDAPVLFVGPAPGLVNGLVQINARIPANAPVGAAVPIAIRIGTTDSAIGPTVSIR